MMKTAQSRARDYVSSRRLPAVDRPCVRRVLLERIVKPVLMVIGYVFANEKSQMALIQHDDLGREDLAGSFRSNTPKPAFRRAEDDIRKLLISRPGRTLTMDTARGAVMLSSDIKGDASNARSATAWSGSFYKQT
jgi:hypothetical protein